MANKKLIQFGGLQIPEDTLFILPNKDLWQMNWLEILKSAKTSQLIKQKKSLLASEDNYVEGNDPLLDDLLSILLLEGAFIVKYGEETLQILASMDIEGDVGLPIFCTYTNVSKTNMNIIKKYYGKLGKNTVEDSWSKESLVTI
jgi:hypothetical protein